MQLPNVCVIKVFCRKICSHCGSFLFGNLLVCDCDAIWLYEFLRNRSLNTAFCEKPGAVAGKRLSAISRLEFCGM